jgi:5-methylcytosine-specific restriction protein A
MMPAQFCSEPGCGVLVPSGKCDAHRPRARMSNVDYARTKPWYDSMRWRRLRVEVLQDEPFCRACRAHGIKVLTVDIDHIRKHNGDATLFWARSNLQGLCKACHTIKTTRGE